MITQSEIQAIQKESNKSVSYYLNGGCLQFAKLLQTIYGGNLRYYPIEEHIVLEHKGYLYDVRGNVTKLYQTSPFLEESEFYRRLKIVKQFVA